MHVALEGSPGEEYAYGYGANFIADWTELGGTRQRRMLWADRRDRQRDDRVSARRQRR